MKEIQISPESCLPSCHQLRFTATEIHNRLEVSDFCPPGVIDSKHSESFFSSYTRFLINSGAYDTLYHKRYANKSEDTSEFFQSVCKELVRNDMARVSVMFESKRYVKTSTDVKTTFVDSFSSIGKLITNIYNYLLC